MPSWGFEPGADRAAIEQAYRELIKHYHPDRSGGDAARAAEINRAYFELRQPPASPADRAGAASWRLGATAAAAPPAAERQHARCGRCC